MYVTLEPCDHYGRTPPCTEAILTAGITRVVYANQDPNPQASGGGERLSGLGVRVDGGVLAKEAAAVNRVFDGRWRLGRPYVVVKAGITLDGKIADSAGNSRWITDDIARKRSHELRAELGCVLVGTETALRDNPSLTCREADGRVDLRVILDPHRRLPDDLAVFVTDDAMTLRVTAERVSESDHVVPMRSGALDLRAVLEAVADRGLIGVLVEGGGKTIGEFFRQGLVDEVELHVAPKALGGGVSWIEAPTTLEEAWRFSDVSVEPLGSGFAIRAKVSA